MQIPESAQPIREYRRVGPNLTSGRRRGEIKMSCGTKDGKPHLYTPMKAIRRKCLDCCCASSKEVTLCPVHNCSLHPYRLGRRPGAGKREMTPARLAALRRANESRLKAHDSSLASQDYEEKLANSSDEGER